MAAAAKSGHAEASPPRPSRRRAVSEEQPLALGRYRPLRPLGTGGSGSVWLARDERNGLDVALKIVPLEGKAGNRAEREAEACARLRHPGCLRAYAVGRERGHFYIAYDYVPGKTLRDALRARELDDTDAVEACAQLAEAVAHAHSRGILHRDVKPANVLVVDGASVSIRLLDFGLAAFDDAQTLTAPGDVPGTLAYISPERLAGGDSTPAADVWAIGAILWEALAGRHPFVRQTLRETGDAIDAGAPPLISVRPDLPRDLCRAVDAALSVDPRKRPSAAALADALRSVGAPRRADRASSGLRLASPFAFAAAAGLYAGAAAVLLPFWPAPLAFAIAAAATTIAFFRKRLGFAVALGAAVFPVGNLSLGLAIAYGGAAAALLALANRREVLAGVGALLVYGIARPPDAAVAGVDEPIDAARGLVLAVPPEAWRLALVTAVAVATLSLARTPWRIAVWGAAVLALTLLPNPGIDAWPVVAVVWVACAGRALRPAT